MQRIFEKHTHVCFQVYLEPIFISALFLAHLTVPPEALEAFGLHLVGEPFCRSDFCLRHKVSGRKKDFNSGAKLPATEKFSLHFISIL